MFSEISMTSQFVLDLHNLVIFISLLHVMVVEPADSLPRPQQPVTQWRPFAKDNEANAHKS